MDCFQDFCLFCDRDSPDGPYCSQRCKLADLEKASTSQPGSPTSSSRPDHREYVLSPAYKFHHDQQQRTPGYDAPAVTNSRRRPQSSYFMWTASPSTQRSDRSSLEDRSLSPSSSRTSLSSTSSGSSGMSSTGAFSAQAKQQLQEYFSSFDQARAAKRRSSTRST